ncbi:hypothetical protein [Mycoplasma sp. 392]
MKKPLTKENWLTESYENFSSVNWPTLPFVKAFFDYILEPNQQNLQNKSFLATDNLTTHNLDFSITKLDLSKFQSLQMLQDYKLKFISLASQLATNALFSNVNIQSLKDWISQLNQESVNAKKPTWSFYINNTLIYIYKHSLEDFKKDTSLINPNITEIRAYQNILGQRQIKLTTFFTFDNTQKILPDFALIKKMNADYLLGISKQGKIYKINGLNPILVPSSCDNIATLDLYSPDLPKQDKCEEIPAFDKVIKFDINESQNTPNNIDLVFYLDNNKIWYGQVTIDNDPQRQMLNSSSYVYINPNINTETFQITELKDLEVNSVTKKINNKINEFATIYLSTQKASQSTNTNLNRSSGKFIIDQNYKQSFNDKTIRKFWDFGTDNMYQEPARKIPEWISKWTISIDQLDTTLEAKSNFLNWRTEYNNSVKDSWNIQKPQLILNLEYFNSSNNAKYYPREALKRETQGIGLNKELAKEIYNQQHSSSGKQTIKINLDNESIKKILKSDDPSIKFKLTEPKELTKYKSLSTQDIESVLSAYYVIDFWYEELDNSLVRLQTWKKNRVSQSIDWNFFKKVPFLEVYLANEKIYEQPIFYSNNWDKNWSVPDFGVNFFINSWSIEMDGYEYKIQKTNQSNQALKLIVREDKDKIHNLRFDIDQKLENLKTSQKGYYLGSTYYTPILLDNENAKWEVYAFDTDFDTLLDEEGNIQEIITKQPYKIGILDEQWNHNAETNPGQIFKVKDPDTKQEALVYFNLLDTWEIFVKSNDERSQEKQREINEELDRQAKIIADKHYKRQMEYYEQEEPYEEPVSPYETITIYPEEPQYEDSLNYAKQSEEYQDIKRQILNSLNYEKFKASTRGQNTIQLLQADTLNPFVFMEQNAIHIAHPYFENGTRKTALINIKYNGLDYSKNNYPYLFAPFSQANTLSETFKPATVDAYKTNKETKAKEFYSSTNVSNVIVRDNQITFMTTFDKNALQELDREDMVKDFKVLDNNKNVLFEFKKDFQKTSNETVLLNLNHSVNWTHTDSNGEVSQNNQRAMDWAKIFTNPEYANKFLINKCRYKVTYNTSKTYKWVDLIIDKSKVMFNSNTMWINWKSTKNILFFVCHF